MTNEEKKLRSMVRLVRFIWGSLSLDPWPGDEVTALRFIAGEGAPTVQMSTDEKVQELARLARGLFTKIHPELPWPGEVGALRLLVVDAEFSRHAHIDR